MRFNPHAFKRITEPPPPVAATAPASTSADNGPDAVSAAFIAAYGRPGANQITVPEGSMAVTLSLKFNDSAPQVDHFDYHAPTGCPAFLVLLVKKQAQTENLARKALTACPELHSLDWMWKSEKYGGGHGNYLQSSYFPTPPALKEHITVRKTYCALAQPVALTQSVGRSNLPTLRPESFRGSSSGRTSITALPSWNPLSATAATTTPGEIVAVTQLPPPGA